MPVARVPVSGYPRFNFTPRSGSITWKWRINWADITPFLYEIFPASTSTSIFQSEAEPLSKKLYASSVDIEALGGEQARFSTGLAGDYTSTNLYQNGAIATVTYSTPESNLTDTGSSNPNTNGDDPVPFLSHSWSCGGEYINFDDEAKITWGTFEDNGVNSLRTVPVVSNDTAKGVEAGFAIPTIEHQIKWSKVKKPPFEVIRDRIGCINSDNIWLRTTGSKRPVLPQCLMFIGAELSQDVFADGSKGWEMTYRFSERIIKAEQLARVPTFSGGIFATPPSALVPINSYLPSALVYGTLGGYLGTYVPPPPSVILYGGWNHFFDTKTGGFRPLLKPDGQVMFPLRKFMPDLVTQST